MALDEAAGHPAPVDAAPSDFRSVRPNHHSKSAGEDPSQGGEKAVPLPGEAGALPMRYLGAPITEAEALGVARRQLRQRNPAAVLDELPAADAQLVLTAMRLEPRVVAFARARAEMEGLNLVDVLRSALSAYASGRPGTPATFQASPRNEGPTE